MRITIIGAGNMAGGIGARALAGGHTVRIVDNDPAKAQKLAAELAGRSSGADVAGAGKDAGPDLAAEADIVVLALHYEAGKAVAAEYGDALAGKTVIDISNPVDFTTFDSLVTPPGSSAAEEIAAAAHPDAHVVKAFNTTFAGTLVTGEVARIPLDVFIAGDDIGAKQQVTELAASGGLNPIDAGALKRARELEALQFLHMTLQQPLGSNWSSAIKILLPVA